MALMTDPVFSEQTLSRRTVFHGKVLTLEVQDVRLETGADGYREIIRHPGSVGVLAQRQDGRFVLVRQFRKPVESMVTEVVAGLVDSGEAHQEAAERELREETGYQALAWMPLGIIHASPGYTEETVEGFFAIIEDTPGRIDPDPDERIALVTLTEEQVSEAVVNGTITDGKTLAMWGKYLLRKSEAEALRCP